LFDPNHLEKNDTQQGNKNKNSNYWENFFHAHKFKLQAAQNCCGSWLYLLFNYLLSFIQAIKKGNFIFFEQKKLI
jgi:hypothetical protein